MHYRDASGGVLDVLGQLFHHLAEVLELAGCEGAIAVTLGITGPF